MIRLGKVYGNLMVDLRATSAKLADRSLRIVTAVTGAGREEARRLLLAAGGSVKTAIAMRELGVDRWVAERRLDACEGFLATALERFAPGSPCHCYSDYPEGGSAAEAGRLLDSLAEGPLRLAAAVDEARDRGLPAERASRHLAHLLAFETEAVRPRLDSLAAARDEPDMPIRFADWDGGPPADDETREAAVLLAAFKEERGRTVELLRSRGHAFQRRRAAVAEESFTVYQFLRGVAHHDEAHALRIRERVHPSLEKGGPA
jgi:hypothetical protein